MGYPCRMFRNDLEHEKIISVYFQDQTGKKWTQRIKKKDKKVWLSSRGEGWKLSRTLMSSTRVWGGQGHPRMKHE